MTLTGFELIFCLLSTASLVGAPSPDPADPGPEKPVVRSEPIEAEPAEEPTPIAEPEVSAPTPASSPTTAPPVQAEPNLPPEAAPAPTTNHNDEVSPFVPRREIEVMKERPVGSGTWKPGTGLQFRSEDKRFSVAIRTRAMFLYELEHDAASNEIEHVFQIRRARLVFKGNVFGEHNKYKIELAFSPRDMNFRNGVPTNTPIFDWTFTFDYLRDFTVKVGQYKIPFNRQRVISSGDLQLVDRSIGNAEFNLDRDIGIEFLSEDVGGLGYLRYHAGIYMGEGRDVYVPDDFGMNYLARVEVLPLGGADGGWDYDEVDWDRRMRPRLSLGAAYAFIDEANRDRGILGNIPLDGGTTDYHNVTADVVFRAAGFSLSGEFYYRNGTRDYGNATIVDDMGVVVPAPRIPSRDGVGYYVQPAFLIPRIPFEIAARWGQIFGLGGASRTSLPDGDEVGGGISYYFARHNLKLQADYFRLRNDDYDAAALQFSDQSWADSVDRFRLQLQVAF